MASAACQTISSVTSGAGICVAAFNTLRMDGTAR